MLSFFAFMFVITGCKTLPDFSQKNYPGVVIEEGKVLIYFNLSRDRILLDHFLLQYSSDDLSSIIDRTERLSFSTDGFHPDSDFTILAEGNFPRGISNLAMSRESSWKKHRDKYIWWENKDAGLFASVPFRSLAIISNTDIRTKLGFLDSGVRNYIPENVKKEFEYSEITIYSQLPGKNIYESLKIPSEKMLIQELYIVVKKDEGNYSISGVLNFLNEYDARVFSTALKLGLLIKLRETAKTSIMKIVHDGRISAVDKSVILDNIVLDTDDMIGLFSGNEEGLRVTN